MISPKVRARFSQPAHLAADHDLETAQFTGRAESADHRTRVLFALQTDGKAVRTAHFRVLGCPWTVAAADLVCEQMAGAEAAALARAEASGWAEALEIPPERLGRLLVIEDALRNALQAWENTPLT